MNNQPNKQTPSFPGKDNTQNKAAQPNQSNQADKKPAEGQKGTDAQATANKPSDAANETAGKSSAA